MLNEVWFDLRLRRYRVVSALGTKNGDEMSWTDLDLVEVRAVAGESGVFARRDIAGGTVVGVFDGAAQVFDLASDGLVDWRGQDGSMSIHLRLTDGKLYAIMPQAGVEISGIDFINHSCKANCRADAGVLVVETIRAIEAGEQLTINYHDMDLIKLGRPCWCEGIDDGQRCIL